MCSERKVENQIKYDELNANEQKLLLDEYKIGYDAYYRSEEIYTSRENFFFVAQGIIVAATVQLLTTNEGYYGFVLLIIPLGIFSSSVWVLMQYKSSQLAYNRLNRLKAIEKIISQKEIFKFFSETSDNENKEFLGIKFNIFTWTLRKFLPIIFLFFWFSFLIIQLWYGAGCPLPSYWPYP